MRVISEIYAVLDDDEMHQTRRCMDTCNPVGLTDEQGKIRMRLMSDRKFAAPYVQNQILPYLKYLVSRYDTELRYAREQIETATGKNALGDVKLQWQVIVSP